MEVSWPEARGSVRRLLERMPPPLRELIGSLQKIGVPEQGATSDVIFVSGSNGRFVVKRATRPPYHDWLRREHEVLGSLSPQTAFIPKPLGFVEEPDRGRPSNWLLMEHLPGVPLSDVLRRGVGSAERRRLLFGFGRALSTTHRQSAPSGLRSEQPWLDHMLDLAGHYLRRYEVDGDAAVLDAPEALGVRGPGGSGRVL